MFNKVADGFRSSYQSIQTLCNSEPCKSLIEFFNLAFGCLAVHNLIRTFYIKDKEIEILYKDLPGWQQCAWKIADLLGNLSLIIGALKSQSTIAFFKWSVQKIVSQEHLEKLSRFHDPMASQRIHFSLTLISFLLKIPSTLKTAYAVFGWINHHRQKQSKVIKKDDPKLQPVFTPIPLRNIDIYITVKTVSETARKVIIHSARK